MTRDRQKAKAIGKVLVVLIVVSLAFVISANAADNTQVTVVLKDRAEVSGQYIQVKDVAQINSADQKAVAGIGNIYLGLAPELGEENKVDMAWVKKRIGQNAYDMNLIDFKGPDETVIKSVKAKAKAKAREQVEAQKAKAVPAKDEEAKADAEDNNLIMINENTISNIILNYMSEKHKTPAKNLYIKVSDKLRWKSGRGEELKCATAIEPINIVFEKRNSDIATVMFLVTEPDGGKVRNEAKAEITFIGECVMANQAIRRGDIIQQDAIKLEKIKISISDYLNTAKTIEACVGRRVAKALRAGDMVCESDLEKPADVKPDDIITIDVKSNGCTIRSMAVASEGGCVGDYIQVRNYNTNRPWMKQVRITGRGMAELVITNTAPAEEKEEAPRRYSKRYNKRTNEEKPKTEKARAEQKNNQVMENNRYRGETKKISNVETQKLIEQSKFGANYTRRHE